MSFSTQQYRRAIGYALDDLAVYTVSAAASSTVSSALLANNTPNASANAHNGKWVYVATGLGAGQVRRVRTGGYNPNGTLTVDVPWTTQPLAGDVIELTGFFPAVQQVGSDTSYLTLTNGGLRHLKVPDRITLPITTSQEYPLAAYPWLDRNARLLRVLEPGPTGGLPILAGMRRPILRLDAGAPVLELTVPFLAASGNLSLDVFRPGDTLVNGASSTMGLVAETDTAEPSINDVETEALVEAYFALMSRSPARPNGAWAQKWQAQREIARGLFYHDETQDHAPAAPAGQPTAGAA